MPTFACPMPARQYTGKVAVSYGDDLRVEKVAPLPIATPKRVGEQAGWVYNSIEYKEKHLLREEESLWAPASVGCAELSAINIMMMRGGYLELDEGLNQYLIDKYGSPLTQIVANLIKTRIFAREGEYLRPVAESTHVLSNGDGSGYVASDQNRFDAWCQINGKTPSFAHMIFSE